MYVIPVMKSIRMKLECISPFLLAFIIYFWIIFIYFALSCIKKKIGKNTYCVQV